MSKIVNEQAFIEQQKQYWSERTYAAMEASQRNADILLNELLKVHQNAYSELTDSLSSKLSQLGIDKANWTATASAQDIAKLNKLLKEALDADREGLMSGDAQIALDISRLDAMLTEIELQLTKIAAQLNTDVASIKSETYERIFNDFSLELESFAVTNKKAVELAVNKIWAGEHFSDSIWSLKNKLMKILHSQISTGILTGEPYDVMAKKLAKAMRSSYANAVRIVRTETAYIMNQATQDAYQKCEVVEGQEWLTHEDERTCAICSEKNGKEFIYENGTPTASVDTPPGHPHCRCTLIPLVKRPDKPKYNEQKKDDSQLKYLEDKYGIPVNATD